MRPRKIERSQGFWVARDGAVHVAGGGRFVASYKSQDDAPSYIQKEDDANGAFIATAPRLEQERDGLLEVVRVASIALKELLPAETEQVYSGDIPLVAVEAYARCFGVLAEFRAREERKQYLVRGDAEYVEIAAKLGLTEAFAALDVAPRDKATQDSRRSNRAVLEGLRGALCKQGTLSESQVRFALSLASRLDEVNVEAPVGGGVEFTGVIVSADYRTEISENPLKKINVKVTTSEGVWMVLMTCPHLLVKRETSEIGDFDLQSVVGLTETFRANLKPSSYPHLAYGSHPRLVSKK